jgi:ribonuclease T2
MVRSMLRAAACAAVVLAAGGGAAAQSQDRDQGQIQAQAQAPRSAPAARQQPGKFDFYVLSLSWSPSFCEATAERGRESRDQCGARPFSFVVHGLWPQYERGFPRNCQVPSPRLNRDIMTSMLDIMPAPGLVFHEWDQHGTCSGLSTASYFDLVRKARETVNIPEAYEALKAPITVDPNDVEDAFIKANPGLSRAGIAVTCDSKRLSEVRICLSKDLQFRDCAEIDRRACRRDTVIMPPVRGG